MINKTKDYELFVFRDDNREKIDQAHVKKLIESIKAKNLLDLRPICVNDKMEVIDGQHRLLAAKALGVEIYYQQDKKLKAEDIVRMNISKAWTIGDYLNFYCQHQYDEYIKLKNFMNKNNLSLNVALNITMGQKRITFVQFKHGEFQFEEEEFNDSIDICWESINYIKKMNGFCRYTDSNRFWRALLRVVNHPDFEEDRWRSNIKKMIDHFGPRGRMTDYISLMASVYNYRATTKINFMDE